MMVVKHEKDETRQKDILRKALEHTSASVLIWKTLVGLEQNPEVAKLLL